MLILKIRVHTLAQAIFTALLMTSTNGRRLFQKKEAVLKKATWDTLIRKAYGFGIYKRLDKVAVGHDGIVNGFIANLDGFINEGVVILFLSNVRTGALNYLANGLAGAFYNNKVNMPSLPEYSTAPKNKNLQQWVGSYELFPGFNLDISFQKGRLYLRGKGGYFTYLDFIKDNTFFYRSLYAYIEFKKEGDNYILNWRDLVSGSVYPAKRISK